MSAKMKLWLVRHGETAWSRAGRHTGRTDVPLSQGGKHDAEWLGRMLAGRRLALVLTSPLSRARATCMLAGLGDRAEVDADLCEWDYGSYEGRTTAEIRREVAGWTVWTGEVPAGERITAVAARADRVIARVLAADGEVALFSHGHFLRILAARWLGFAPEDGRLLTLSAGSLSALGFEYETRVVVLWNVTAHTDVTAQSHPEERRPG